MTSSTQTVRNVVTISTPPHSTLFLAGGEPSLATFRLRLLFRVLWGQRLLLFSARLRGLWLLAMELVLEVSSEQFFQSDHALAPWEGFKLSGAKVKSEISHGFCPYWTVAVVALAAVALPQLRLLPMRLKAMVKGSLPQTLPNFSTFSGLICNSSALSSYLSLNWSLMNTSKHAICHSLDFSRIGK